MVDTLNVSFKLLIKSLKGEFNMENNLYVFGHQKPDTDTICSSIVLANLEQALGHEATAYKLGNVNKETAYALNYLLFFFNGILHFR